MTLSFLRVRGSPAQVDLFVELIPNRHNLALTEGPERTVRTLFRTEDGRRTLRTGHPYAPPPAGSDREGRDAAVTPERWREVWESEATVSRRRRALIGAFAWTSTVNARALATAGPEDGHACWATLAAVARRERPPIPVILADPRGAQPYPVPLPGVEHRPVSDLFTAVDLANRTDDAPPAALLSAVLVERLAGHVDALRSRCGRIEAEAAALPDPDELRALGDLLLARFGDVPQGGDSVVLEGFDGVEVSIPLEPELSPDANARRYYDEAARAERAAERLPGLAAEAREAFQAAATLLERAQSGEADA
ncbi:MAG: NFACT family protein, partial [Gemmatimonadetes bacterium]|nr:NFACT family protein [Gemmatimonadota bacterium]